MIKELKVLEIMQKEKCSWEEANAKHAERPSLNKFF